METPSDSDRSRRERRKTACEIFFEEEPAFSDSEDEAEFLRQTYGELLKKKSEPNLANENLAEKLSKDILQVCCGECVCCHKITDIIDYSWKSASPDYENYLVKKPMKRRKLAEEKHTRAVNIISDYLIRDSHPLSLINNNMQKSSSLLAITGKHLQKNQKQTGIKNEKKPGKSIPQSHKKRKKFRLSLPPKRLSNLEKRARFMLDNDQDFDMVTASFNPKRGIENVKQKLDFGLEDNVENNKSILNKRRPKASSKSLPNLSNTILDKTSSNPIKKNIKQKLDFSSEDDVENDQIVPNKRRPKASRKSSNLSETIFDKASSKPKRTIKNVEQKLGFSLKDDVENNKNVPNKRRPKASSKSLPNLSDAILDKDALWERKNCSLTNVDDYEPRNSLTKQHSPVAAKRGSKIRIFEIPLNINVQGFSTTILRKLARKAGNNLNVESLSIENGDFRSQTVKKMKKLYSADDWLKSAEFDQNCSYDD